MSLMGVDIGQGGVKAAVFDQSGNILSRAYQEYPNQAKVYRFLRKVFRVL